MKLCCHTVAIILFSNQRTLVFGFLNASFSGVERDYSYSVSVGYLKGGQEAGQNLVFNNVQNTPGTASELTVLGTVYS